MDIEQLQEQINEGRLTDLILTMNSGKEHVLPPGTKAYIQGFDTLLVLWPGKSEFHVSKSLWISAINVSTAHSEATAA